MTSSSLTLVGRSSSHFTRVARLFAEELGLAYSFQVVPNLRALERDAYGGHPALRVPTLLAPSGAWFGSLNVCRELARLSSRELRVVLPEHHLGATLANAQELTLQAMATEVELIMTDAPTSELALKRRQSLEGTLGWLEEHVEEASSALPERDLSYFEVTLFCLVTHLEFRGVLSTAPFPRLCEQAGRFGERPSARATSFRFD